MKQLTVFFVLIFCSTKIFAQQNNLLKPSSTSELPSWTQLMYSGADIGDVTEAYQEFYESNSFEKNFHTQYYKRLMMLHLRDNNGALFNQELDDHKFSQENYLEASEALKYSRGGNPDWICIGPIDFDKEGASRSYAAGAAHVYTTEQSMSNTNVLYSGTANAGVWRTNDKGLNWFNLTDGMMLGTVVALEIDHTNEDVIYFGGNNNVYKSVDGGQTWINTGDNSFQSAAIWVNDMIMSPTNNQELWIACDQGLYHTIDGGGDWTLQYNGIWQEIEINPADPQIMYAIKQPGAKTEFYKSTDGGNSFTQRLGGYPDAQNPDEQMRTEIAVTPIAPNIVYAFATGVADSGSGLYGIYVSHDAGENWTFQCCGTGPGGVPDANTNKNLCAWSDEGDDDGGQYYYDLSLEVSPFDSNEVHVCAVNHWVSDNAGIDWYCPSKWSHSYKPDYVHADIHDIHFYGSDWWISCDGGIFYSSDQGANWNRKMYGIAGTDFWGFGVGEWEGDEVMVGGTYHNGTLLKDFNTYENGWLSTMGGDNVLGAVNYGYPRIIFSDYGKHKLSGDRTVDLLQLTASMLPDVSYWTGESSEMEFHPYEYNTVLIGKDTSIWISHDNGAGYDMLHEWSEGKITHIEIAASDPNIMYVVRYDGWWLEKRIFRTTDGGLNWTEVTPPNSLFSNQNLWAPFAVTINPDNPDEIWMVRTMQSSTYANLDGLKVYRSVDGGLNWTNYTTNTLDGEYPTCIEYQRGTDGGVYLGTRRGVYYRNNSMSDWTLYNNGLPLSTTATALHLDYKNQRIVNGSNRSAWVAPFYETGEVVANISVNSKTVTCTRDTVYFVDHSNISATNASWQWTFENGNPSTSTLRTPKVIFPSIGSFDVSLTVTDANGTDTQTLTDFISVNSTCEPDSVPGNAVTLDGQYAFASIPPLNLNSNTITITAWIKPSGTQNDWAGIVFSRAANTLAGMSLTSANELRMHWNDDQWPWQSGLYVDSNAWSHVAMVVTPTATTLYVNGVGSTNTFNAAAEEFNGETMIGLDNCCGNRHFTGLIDEVCIYNRSLSQNEIREQMHLTKNDISDPNLVAYYQFNETSGNVVDRIGTKHASLANGASRVVSTGPFGGGTSSRLLIASNGTYTFSNTGFDLSFASGSTIPDGEVVVSRINLYPDNLPDPQHFNARSYWIADNYGVNQTFTAPSSVNFENIGYVSAYDVLHPDHFKLFMRGHNADLNTWGNSINDADACVAGADGDVSFSSSNSITSFGQFDLVNTEAFPTDVEPTLLEISADEFSIYPNPVTEGTVFVKSSADRKFTLTIFNSIGQKIRQQSFVKQGEMKTDDLSAGTYLYRIKSDTHFQNGVLIVD